MRRFHLFQDSRVHLITRTGSLGATKNRSNRSTGSRGSATAIHAPLGRRFLYIVHAQAGVRHSLSDPHAYGEANLIGFRCHDAFEQQSW
jgi:hypothetical protein